MIGLAIMSVLIVVLCIVPQIDIINEYEVSENTISLEGFKLPNINLLSRNLKNNGCQALIKNNGCQALINFLMSSRMEPIKVSSPPYNIYKDVVRTHNWLPTESDFYPA
jgi:hypothetical protein